MTAFANPLAEEIWSARYRFRGADGEAEPGIDATWSRVAAALAAAEPADRAGWMRRFAETLADFRFLPGGRILAGAGTGRRVTLFNCFVMGTLEDSLDGIFAALRESALTMQQGGGIGVDFSPLRPEGAPADATGGHSSGPVSFMHLWDQMCATVTDVGPRRGAMMGTLSCDHPDIEAFVTAKRASRRLTHFNLSVLATNAFMEAALSGRPHALAFPRLGIARDVDARALWDTITRCAYESAEPGVLFIDRIRAEDNLAYAETISATNPCGEIPLPPYGACDLGSLNLTRFVRDAFGAHATLDHAALASAATIATRMLDDVYSVAGFPLPQQAAAAAASRRLGLGITGLGDALVMLNLRYDSEAGRQSAAEAMRTIMESAYAASIELARERGSFPLFDRERFLAAPFVARLPAPLRDGIARYGLRNSHLTAIAPAGTISLIAGNIASGVEPIFAAEYTRNVRQQGGALARVNVESYSLAAWRAGGRSGRPPAFVTADSIAAQDQIAMLAALQPFVDNAISKTTNVREDIDFGEFAAIYRHAWEQGLKGCTVFRPNRVTGAVLTGPEPRCEHCETGEVLAPQ
jgi:ribonucleoside-diphosphate reductase alpha chain